MHYKNGRLAKAGDTVISVNPSNPCYGILHSVSESSTTCNGRVARKGLNDPYITIGDCLHVDDIAAAATAGAIEKGL